MPTNANLFNSRVTSEALEKKFRDVFPAQAGAELIQDLYASGVIQPVIDFSTVAEGSVLPENLQTAWDFSTGFTQVTPSTNPTIINNAGFWQVDLNAFLNYNAATSTAQLQINDGSTNKVIWSATEGAAAISEYLTVTQGKFVVFLRSGDELQGNTGSGGQIDVWYRQIADVNGNLVNPLGFTFS